MGKETSGWLRYESMNVSDDVRIRRLGSCRRSSSWRAESWRPLVERVARRGGVVIILGLYRNDLVLNESGPEAIPRRRR